MYMQSRNLWLHWRRYQGRKHKGFGTVTGILVLEKLVWGPKFQLEKMVPRTIFSGEIDPTLKILVPPEAFTQYHVVLVERAVLGTLTQDSVWYIPPLTVRALNPTVFGSSGILQTQYTRTSSTDFTVDSVAHLSRGHIHICLLSKQLHRWRRIFSWAKWYRPGYIARMLNLSHVIVLCAITEHGVHAKETTYMSISRRNGFS